MSANGFIDPSALERSLGPLIERTDARPLAEALPALLDATQVLFEASGAGMMFVDEESLLRSVAATDEPGYLLETRQEETGEGPCVDALVLDTVVQSPDLAADQRWPKLLPEVPRRGVRAVLGVPVHVSKVPVGSLNVYRRQPHGWDGSEVRALETYAGLLERLLASALQAQQLTELAQQLQHALDNRVRIERAVGLLMGREGIDAVTAFNRLRSIARSSEQRVADLAEAILEGAPLVSSAGRTQSR